MVVLIIVLIISAVVLRMALAQKVKHPTLVAFTFFIGWIIFALIFKYI